MENHTKAAPAPASTPAPTPASTSAPASTLTPTPTPAASGKPQTWRERLKGKARLLRRDGIALYLAMKDPRTPWTARALGFLTCAYAFSPIDLIPDFIPIIGQLDDIILVPIGIVLTLRLVPAPLLDEFRAQADRIDGKPLFRGGLLVVVLSWGIAILLLLGLVYLIH